MMKRHYPVLFAGDPDLPAAAGVRRPGVEWSEFLARVLGAAYGPGRPSG